MQYTKYYSDLLKTQGQPHLNLDEHKRLFNIISLECRIDEMSQFKDGLNPEHKKALFMKIEAYKKQIHKLTRGLQPSSLFLYMVEHSLQ
ncbi:MAG: hypothetical protein GYB32_13015 [Algicola sp.]|nr:hypothetical protein [Algicola sp.]